MPLYSYKCKTCQKQADKWNSMTDHANGPECCGEIMKQVYNAKVSTFKEFVTDNITGEPVRVSSEKQHQKLLKEHNLGQIYGKGWI